MAENTPHAVSSVTVEQITLTSEYLEREVIVDVYFPVVTGDEIPLSLLLINDGQDLVKMPFEEILNELIAGNSIEPLLCVGIHCGQDRKM